MGNSLYQILNISQQDMRARLLNLDVVSNNLANVNTVGFKRSRANFQELLQNAEKEGVRVGTTQILTTQGPIRDSDNSMDWAITGDGYFAVKLPDGRTAYTRDGRFNLDGNGRIVNSGGYPLVWDGQVPAGVSKITVRLDGTVVAGEEGSWTQLGRVQLTRFSNPSGLQVQGENLLLATPAAGTLQVGYPNNQNFGSLSSNAVEESNVNLANEMTQLINLERTFQISVKTFQQTDQMISQAIHMRKG